MSAIAGQANRSTNKDFVYGFSVKGTSSTSKATYYNDEWVQIAQAGERLEDAFSTGSEPGLLVGRCLKNQKNIDGDSAARDDGIAISIKPNISILDIDGDADAYRGDPTFAKNNNDISVDIYGTDAFNTTYNFTGFSMPIFPNEENYNVDPGLLHRAGVSLGGGVVHKTREWIIDGSNLDTNCSFVISHKDQVRRYYSMGFESINGLTDAVSVNFAMDTTSGHFNGTDHNFSVTTGKSAGDFIGWNSATGVKVGKGIDITITPETVGTAPAAGEMLALRLEYVNCVY